VANGTCAQLQLSEKDLRQWDLLAAFRQALACHAAPADMDRSWSDRRRTCDYAGNLSLFLFGLFNPALETMRALCAASRLPRVQREVTGGHASLGSFSEAQHLTVDRKGVGQ
jgi:hypothetical protein